jgi:hypothetical protein
MWLAVVSINWPIQGNSQHRVHKTKKKISQHGTQNVKTYYRTMLKTKKMTNMDTTKKPWTQVLAKDMRFFEIAYAKLQWVSCKIRMGYPYLKWQWIFYFLCRCFLSYITDYYWTWMYIWRTRRVSYKKQDQLTLRGSRFSWWCSYWSYFIGKKTST